MKSRFVIWLTLTAPLIIAVVGASAAWHQQEAAIEKHPLVLKIKEFRAAREKDPKAAQAFLADDPRVWYEKKEGAGQAWRFNNDSWTHWDKFFKQEGAVFSSQQRPHPLA